MSNNAVESRSARVVRNPSSTNSKGATPPYRRKPVFEALEPRVLLSADVAGVAAALADGVQDLGGHVQDFIDNNPYLNTPLPVVMRPEQIISGGDIESITVAAKLRDLLSMDVQNDNATIQSALEAIDDDSDGKVELEEWLGFAFLDKIVDRLEQIDAADPEAASAAALASNVASYIGGLDAGFTGTGFSITATGNAAVPGQVTFDVDLVLDFSKSLPLDLGLEMEQFGISFPDVTLGVELDLALSLQFGVFFTPGITPDEGDFFVDAATLSASASATADLAGASVNIGFIGAQILAPTEADHSVEITASVSAAAQDPTSATRLGFNATQFGDSNVGSVTAGLYAEVTELGLSAPGASFYLRVGEHGDTTLVTVPASDGASLLNAIRTALGAAGFEDGGLDTVEANVVGGDLVLSLKDTDFSDLNLSSFESSGGQLDTGTIDFTEAAEVSFLLSVGGALPLFIQASGNSLANLQASLSTALTGTGVSVATNGGGLRFTHASKSFEIARTITVDSKITLADVALGADLLPDGVTTGSSVEVDLPIQVSTGLTGTFDPARIRVESFDPFSFDLGDLAEDTIGNLKLPLELDLSGFEDLLNFNNLSASSFISLLGQLKDWLAGMAESELFDAEIPLANTTLGEVLDFADVLQDALLFDDGDDGVDGGDRLLTDINRALDSAGLGGEVHAVATDDGKIKLVGNKSFSVGAGAAALGLSGASSADSVKQALVGSLVIADFQPGAVNFTLTYGGEAHSISVDATGNTALGNDVQRLLDAANTPVFGNAQELARELAYLLELDPSVVNATYNGDASELTFELKLASGAQAFDLPLNFSLADLGINLSPLVDLSTESELHFAADGSLSLTLGVYLGGAGSESLISETTDLDTLHDGDGAGIKEELAITAASAPTTIVGQLTQDASFKYKINGGPEVSVTLTAAATSTNATIANLVADLDAAIGADLVVGSSGNRITLTTAAAVTSFEIIADSLNPAVTQLGLQPGKIEKAVATNIAVIAAKDAPTLVGRLPANATFNVNVNGAGDVPVTVLKADTDSNTTILDLVDDVNAALAGQIAGGAVAGNVLTDDVTFSVTLNSANNDLDDTVSVTVHAGDARMVGFVQNQTGNGTLAANYTAPADGPLAADMTFLLKVGSAEPVKLTIQREDAGSRADLVSEVNAALAGAGITGVTFAYDGVDDKFKFTAVPATALKILSAGTTQGNASLAALASDVNNALQNALQAHFASDFTDGVVPALLEARGSGSSIVISTVNLNDANPNLIQSFSIDAEGSNALGIPTTPASAQNLTDRFEASAQGDKLVLTAIDDSVTSFTVASSTTNGLGLAASSAGNTHDLVIEVQNNSVGTNGRFSVSLDGAETFADVISKIEAQTSGNVQVAISADGTQLVLTDNSGYAGAANGDFHVEATNGSAAAVRLGILRADITNPAQTPDGVIDGAPLGGITLADRFFIEDALVRGEVSVSTPGGAEATAQFGFVEVKLEGDASLFAGIEAGLKAPDETEAGGRIYLPELLDGLADPESIIATPVVLGGGDLDATISVTGFDAALGDTPSISIDLNQIGNPFALVYGTHDVPGAVISDAATFDLTIEGSLSGTVEVSLPASATSGNTTLAQLAEDLQTAIRAALGAEFDSENAALLRVDALGNRLFITAIDSRVTGFEIGDPNDVAQDELGLYEGEGSKAPKLDVATSDLGGLLDFDDIGIDDILAALRQLSDFLGGLEGFGFLDENIPLVNISINDVLAFAERFADAVDELESNPAGSIQALEGKLKEALGLAPTSDVIDIELLEGDNILKIGFDLEAAFTTSLPINFDLGEGLPFDLAGTGQLQADGLLELTLDLGLDLDDLNVVVFDTTQVLGELNLGGEDLAFRAAVGPLGVYIADGEVSLGGNLASAGGTASADLFRLGFDFGDEDYLDIATVLGGFVTYVEADVGAEVDVNLPVYFPTESSHRGFVRFGAGLSFSDDGGFEFDTESLLPEAFGIDGTTEISIGDLFAFDPSQASLLDNILLAIDGIDMFLGGLQDLMNGDVFGVSIPLIGDQLSDAAQFIADFRADFIAEFREEVENLTSPSDNIISIKLFELLGEDGLDILLDSNDDGDITVEDVVLATNVDEQGIPLSENFMQWNVRIGGPIVNASAGIGFDLGIPGLGLETEGAVAIDMDWELAFGFGLSMAEGFYIDVSDTSELQVDIEVTLPDAALTGRLAFLQLRGEDQGTQLGLGFAIDIHNRNDLDDERLALGELGSIGLGIKVAAEANVDLHMTLGLNDELFPGVAASFPEIVADFVLHWGVGDSVFDFDESDGRNHTYHDGGLATLGNAIMDGLDYVAFEDVGLDLGSFLTDVLAPIVEEVQKVTQPIQPIIEILTTPIPVISDLAGPTTLLDLAAAFAKGKFDVGLIKAVADVITLINAIPIPEEGEDLVITFGSFVILDDSTGGGLDLTNPNSTNAIKSLRPDATNSFSQALASKPASSAKSFTQKLTSGGFGEGFSFPILSDPGQIFGLLMGDEATLVQYDMPALVFDFTYTQFFSIFGPLGVSITGKVGATIDFSFGYDTAGIMEFVDTDFKNPELLFNGFFVGDLDAQGNDIPELQLRAGISAAAELNLGVARAGVAGGIFATVNFDLHDPNDDGKLRIYEIATNVLNQAKYGGDLAFLAPLAVFDVTGEVFAKLFAFLKIDLFFFSIDKEFDITPPITIVDFEIPFTRVPTLATEIDGGILQLNMGEFAEARLEGDTTDGSEKFYVKQGAGADKFLVWAPDLGVSEGMAQAYTAGTRIVASAGEGNDILDLSGITSSIALDLQGGVGNDQIYLSNETFTAGAAGAALIRGGAGDDKIRGGAGDDVIYGEQGNDTIGGGDGSDIVFGDSGELSGLTKTVTFSTKDGNDNITGGAGVDFLFGGGGNDVIDGGEGDDVILGDGGRVFQASGVWVAENTNKDAKGGADTLSGGANDDLVYGGTGNDTVHGNDGDDRLHGEDGADVMTGGADDDEIYGGIGNDNIDAGDDDDVVFGEDGNDTVLAGLGDDIVWGGRGADTLKGGEGDDEVYGQSDPDHLEGGGGSDRIVGGYGNDMIWGDNGLGDITGGADLILGGFGSDTIDGQGGGDRVIIGTRGGRGTDLSTIYDTGALADGVDELRIDGTGEDDVFLLRAMAASGTAFVAKLNAGGAIERFNYRGIESLEVNGFSGDDRFVSDDTRAIAALNGGIGDDTFQIGQMFKSERDDDPQTANLADDDVFATVETTRGWLSNGVTFPMTINGGAGNDEFVVFRNKAVLTLNGGDGDDLFTVRAFALAGSQEDDRARTDLKGDAGADTIMYAVNAPVGIDGGDGFDTILVIGTEFGDDFVITDAGVFGGGLNVTYANIERLKVDGAEGDDRYFVLSTDASVVTEIAGGLGSDTFFVGGTPTGEPIPVISNDLKGHSGVILNSIESVEGGTYNGLKIDGVSANVADNDEPFVLVTPSGGASTVTEGGSDTEEGWGYDTYSLVLTRKPDEEVVISIVQPATSPEDRAQGSASLEFWDGSDWVTTLQKTFSTTDWATAQEVRFRAVQDDAEEGTRFGIINHMVATEGADYHELPALSVKVQINDDDRAGVIVTPTGTNTMVVETAEGGTHEYQQDSFEVVLTREPTDDVRVWMDPKNDQVELGGDAQFDAVSGRWYVDFTDANYSSAKNITLTAKFDEAKEGFHSDFIDFVVESLDVDTPASEDETIDYDETTVLQDDIPEDDPKGFVLLNHSPVEGSVTLTIDGVVQDASRFDVVSNTLVFLNQVGDPENRFGKVEVSYSYVVPGYHGMQVRPLVVDLYDDEAAGVIIVESGGSTDVAEGGASDEFKVVLTRAPVGDEVVTIDVQAVKTRTTGGEEPAFFEFQVNTSVGTVTFDADDWHIAKTVTVTAIDDEVIDGDDTQVFAPGPQTVNKIRGPLFVEGAAGEGSISLPEPLMLPNELNFRPSDGAISGFVAGENETDLDQITVSTAVLQAIVDADAGDDIEAIADLVGRTFEIVGDPEAEDQTEAVDRFWRIENITGSGDTRTLHLKNPSQKPETWGDPAPGDLFAITDLADTFFVAEEDQIDFMMVFDNDSVADDVGAMFLQDVDPDPVGELLRGRLTGLGMGPDVILAGQSRPGGITFGDMEVVRVDLGKGSDTLTVSHATIRDAEDKRPDFFTQTIINTGEGDDTVTLDLDAEDGAISLDAGDGNDTVNASASTRDVVIFGGAGDDTLTGGGGADIIFGDRGRVDYVNAEGEVVTRLGHTIVPIPTSFATGSTDTSILDSDGYDADRDGVDETFLPTDDEGLKGLVVTITSGTGQGQSRIITGNTATEIFVNAAWEVNPDNTSTYRISFLPEDQTDGEARGARLILSTDLEVGGNDTIYGGGAAIGLVGGSGDDEIHGGAGGEFVFGDNARIDLVPVEGDDGATRLRVLATLGEAIGGADELHGGGGDDLMFGGAGDDDMFGDAGSDTALGDNGRMEWAGAELDFILTTDSDASTTGIDEIDGGEDDDFVLGGGSADILRGGDGSDVILGDNGRLDFLADADVELDVVQTTDPGFGDGDLINGNGGSDLILGGAGGDEIHGDEGDDLVLGDNGRLDFVGDFVGNAVITAKLEGGYDLIEGNDGNDVVIGGTADDTISAGEGNDVVYGDHATVAFHVLFGSASTVDYTRRENATADSIFTGSGEGAGNDILFGDGGDDMLLGQQGADIIGGGDGDDDIWGGHDVAGGHDAGDTIDAGAGFDVVLGDNGTIFRRDDTLSWLFRGLAGATLYDGVLGGMNATPHMGEGDFTRDITLLDHADGTSLDVFGADSIAGGAGDDMIFGQLGGDTLLGDAGMSVDMDARTASLNMLVEGDDDGDDYIEGNGGADTIYGNLGQDDIIGGSSDLFGLSLVTQRADGDDDLYGGAGTDAGRYHVDGVDLHARDADVILGDNGRIFKAVGVGFNYDDGYGESEAIIPRVFELMDYVPGTGSAAGRFGVDLVSGESGNDIIHGMAGDDILFGDAGDDDLYGGTGHDWISGGGGSDGMLGDDGRIFTSRNGETEALYGLNVANEQDIISTPGNWLSATIFEGGKVNKSVDLEPFDQGGDDAMYGGLGDDFMHGGQGTDGMSGAEAMQPFYDAAKARAPVTVADSLAYNEAERKFEQFNYDAPLAKIAGFFLNFEASIDGAKVNDGDDRLFGDLGNDWLVGGTNRDHLYGGLGDDVMNGDDNLETTGTDGTGSGFDDADLAFGGGGRDQLTANTGTDRLIDWAGEFNGYWVPFSPFGQGTVSRNVAPHVPEFLYALSAADGADPTRGPAGDPRNGEPFGELGLVLQQDEGWHVQTGGPDGPQAGNGKDKKDQQR